MVNPELHGIQQQGCHPKNDSLTGLLLPSPSGRNGRNVELTVAWFGEN